MEAEVAENTTRLKNLPVLRFPEFTVELIPAKLEKVIKSVLYGPRFNANDYSENGNVKTIRGTDLGRDGEIKYHQVPLAYLDEKTISTHKLEDGDIVIITTADCGATGVFRKQNIDFISSAYGVRIRLNELGYPYYFKYFFQTRLSKKQINSFIRKATVANLPGSDIPKIKLFLPAISEQQKIASFLTAVDDKIQQLAKKNDLLEKYKKGMMQLIFSQQIRFKDENGLGFPDWEERLLGKVVNIKKGEQLNKIELTVNGEFPCINGGITASGYTDNFNTRENTITISEGGNSCGFVNILRTKFWSGGHCYALQVIDESSLNNEFLYQLLKFNESRIMKLRVGSGLPNIQKKDINLFNVVIPSSIKEQKRISNFLSSLDNKTNLVTKQLKQTKQFKKGYWFTMYDACIFAHFDVKTLC